MDQEKRGDEERENNLHNGLRVKLYDGNVQIQTRCFGGTEMRDG